MSPRRNFDRERDNGKGYLEARQIEEDLSYLGSAVGKVALPVSGVILGARFVVTGNIHASGGVVAMGVLGAGMLVLDKIGNTIHVPEISTEADAYLADTIESWAENGIY